MHSENQWEWDGQSVYQLLESGAFRAHVWGTTIPDDLKRPVYSIEMGVRRRREYELASVLAVDAHEMALLRVLDVGGKDGWKYTVLPISAVREFFGRCRRQFNH